MTHQRTKRLLDQAMHMYQRLLVGGGSSVSVPDATTPRTQRQQPSTRQPKANSTVIKALIFNQQNKQLLGERNGTL